MSERDLIAFTDSLDRCWMECRFDDLTQFLADDLVFVAPGGSPRVEGRARAIESYRQFLARAEVKSFETGSHAVTLRGDTPLWNTGGR